MQRREQPAPLPSLAHAMDSTASEVREGDTGAVSNADRVMATDGEEAKEESQGGDKDGDAMDDAPDGTEQAGEEAEGSKEDSMPVKSEGSGGREDDDDDDDDDEDRSRGRGRQRSSRTLERPTHPSRPSRPLTQRDLLDRIARAKAFGRQQLGELTRNHREVEQAHDSSSELRHVYSSTHSCGSKTSVCVCECVRARVDVRARR